MQERYVEPARSYWPAVAVVAVCVAGFLVDLLVIGGGTVHALGWALAAVLVAGTYAIGSYAARQLRSIVVTDDELRVGEEFLPRRQILAALAGPQPDVPVLGRRPGEGAPRGTAPVTVALTGDRLIAVASRYPERLAAALGVLEALPDVRPAEPADLAALPEIDARAEALFRAAGIDLPAVAPRGGELPATIAVLVVGRPPVGFAQLVELDGVAHLHELAVLPGHMRRGIGTALLEAACDRARESGYPAITLTTYADVAWNAPFYRRHGFVELTELTPALADERTWERGVGLDVPGRRIAMRRELSSRPAAPGG